MTVREVRFHPVREPVSRRAYTLVKIQTAGGVTGWGEAAGHEPQKWKTVEAALAGVSAASYEVLSRKLAAHGALEAGVNIALLDILGQVAKAPLYQVLGGPTRFKVRAYASVDEKGVAAARSAGYRAVGLKVPEPPFPNSGKQYVLRVKAAMEAAKSAAGAGMDFVIEGDGRLAAGDAQQLAEAFERFHPLWFDEPVRHGNLAALRKVSDENVTPVGVGRAVVSPSEFQDILREEAADLLRPSLANFGVSRIRRIAALAETYYIAVAPHHDGGPVGTAALLHAAASMPNFFIQSIPQVSDARDREMRMALGGAVEKVTDGFAALPTGAGLGIRVDESAIARYREAA